MRILLVRHAHAGVRGTWPGDDLERELSDRGRSEAQAIAEQWADAGVTAVLSSRAVRCVDTVRPLADRLGLAVEEDPRLLEGATPSKTLAWLEGDEVLDDFEGDADTIVACSHGDVIGGIIERLHGRGTDLLDADGGASHGLQWPKGSTWELEVDDGLVVRGRLHGTPGTPGTPTTPTTQPHTPAT